MLTYTTLVSRKTPLDGRLEIPASLADRLQSTGVPLVLGISGTESPVNVEAMACTCAKGAGTNHDHHFIRAESLKALAPDASVTLMVDVEAGRVDVDETP